MIEIIGKQIYLNDKYEIKEYFTENGNVKAFIYDNCIQSLMYLDKNKNQELCLDYFKYLNSPIEINPDLKDF